MTEGLNRGVPGTSYEILGWGATFLGPNGSPESSFDLLNKGRTSQGTARPQVQFEPADRVGLFGGGQKRRPVGNGLGEEARGEERVWGAHDMGPSTRPRIVFGPSDQASRDGVPLDVAYGGDEMWFIERHAGKPALPEIAAPAFAEVHEASVASVGLPQAPRQTVHICWNHNQVDVVGHEAVGPDRQATPFALDVEFMEIGSVIVLAEEDGLAPIASLGDVVRNAWNRDASESGHDLSCTRSYV